jgi:oxygen-independent coproporphyrinogen-3 oxidase
LIDPANIPLALYVHLPWCVRKCPYCDFNSHAVPSTGVPERAYLDALRSDLDLAARDAPSRPVRTVFFGGGTPSLFGPETLARLLEHARSTLPFAADVEITLEANPGTIEHGRFAEYAAAGINRVSLGAQSFDDVALQALGRIHSAHEVERATEELRTARIDDFNLDLMYALPGQDVAGALADIDRAIALGPTHLSHYQLTLEPETPFAKRPPPRLPDDEQAFAIQEACQARLAEAGYGQYEVSAYAMRGRECRHNLAYWRFDDYLGIGAGAHGKVTLADGSVVRTVRARHPAAFLAAPVAEARLAERRVVRAVDLPFEYCLNALRLNSGFLDVDFERHTGLGVDVLDGAMAEALRRTLVVRRDAGWAPTELGRRFLTDLQALFLVG